MAITKSPFKKDASAYKPASTSARGIEVQVNGVDGFKKGVSKIPLVTAYRVKGR